MPKFSIIIPVYNVAPYLRECLDSVSAQTYTDWEAICVDDGSTDSSGAILDEYAARDPRFRVIHQKNTGVSAARNAALDDARGEWVLFVDGDDVIAHNTLDSVVKALTVGGDAELIRFGLIRFATEFKGLVSDESIGVVGVEKNFWAEDFDVSFAQYAYRMDVLNDCRFEVGCTRGEDQLFLARCLMRARRLIRLRSALYGYRTRIGSAVLSSWTLTAFRDQINYYRAFIKLILENEKTIDRELFKLRKKFVTESSVWIICHMPKDVQEDAWRFWFAAIKDFSRFRGFPLWLRISLWLCVVSHSRLIAIILYYLPHWLKMQGFHR